MSIWIILPIAGCIAILLTLWVANRAPEGYEDEKGFHYGKLRNGVSNGSNRLHKHRDFLGNPTNTVRAGNKKKVQKDNREII